MGEKPYKYLNMMKKILYGAHSNVAMGLGLAGGGLGHNVIVEVL